MNPSVQDRLDSCVRALEHVILPALPEHASLAREQTMLVMGQVQIIRAQLDATPAFEEEEAAGLTAMATALCDEIGDRAEGLRGVLNGAHDLLPRERTAAIQSAVDDLLVSYDDEGGAPPAIVRIVCDLGAKRAHKDRAWFSAMGFDAGFAADDPE